MDSDLGMSQVAPQSRPFLKQWTEAALHSVSCGVTYSYEANGVTHLADGVTRAFSTTECEIRGSVMPPVGSKTTLTLSLRDHHRPISFDGTITWTEGESFGVDVSQLDEHDHKRILQWLWELGYVNMIVW
ncbi:MAG TPA: PilZ domain-containing protein [Nitrospira sp.]|nr:PilZ domain-containing protein [Nitrospira sp.]